jgi:hypothetical protein
VPQFKPDLATNVDTGGPDAARFSRCPADIRATNLQILILLDIRTCGGGDVLRSAFANRLTGPHETGSLNAPTPARKHPRRLGQLSNLAVAGMGDEWFLEAEIVVSVAI